jgi:hypothetical protein
VIVIDEAQGLHTTMLEHLRLLSNIETQKEKPMPIVLVGQPELKDMLARPELAQLNQRVTLRWHLEPLSQGEAIAYVRHRLRVAGGSTVEGLFTVKALREAYHFAKGVPRLLNVVSHRALLIGYGKEERYITPKIVRQAIRELRAEMAPSRPSWVLSSLGPSRRVSGLLLGLAMVGLGVVIGSGIVQSFSPLSFSLVAENNSGEEPSVPGSSSGTAVEAAKDLLAPPLPQVAGAAIGKHEENTGKRRDPAETTEHSSGKESSAQGSFSDVVTETPESPPSAPAEVAGVMVHESRGGEVNLADLAADLTKEGEQANEEEAAFQGGTTVTQASQADDAGPSQAEAAESQTSTEEIAGTAVPDNLFQDLRGLTFAESVIRVVDELLRTLDVARLQEEETRGGEPNLSHVARARRLEYLPFKGNLNLLNILDRPVILKLLIPGEGDLRYVLLSQITETKARVFLDQEREVPIEAIEKAWFGEAHLFWRDFEGLGPWLALGSSGPSVQRLQGLLSQAQVYNGPLSVTYNHETRDAVVAFQRANRLVPDGIVGPLTLISLYNAPVPGYPRPHLRVQ